MSRSGTALCLLTLCIAVGALAADAQKKPTGTFVDELSRFVSKASIPEFQQFTADLMDKTLPQLYEQGASKAQGSLECLREFVQVAPEKGLAWANFLKDHVLSVFLQNREVTKGFIGKLNIPQPEAVEFLAGFSASFLTFAYVMGPLYVLVPACVSIFMLIFGFRFILLIAPIRAIWMTVATTVAGCAYLASTMTGANDPFHVLCSTHNCSTLSTLLFSLYVIVYGCHIVAFVNGPLGSLSNFALICIWTIVGLMLSWMSSVASATPLTVNGHMSVYLALLALCAFGTLMSYQQIGIARPKMVYSSSGAKNGSAASAPRTMSASSDRAPAVARRK